MKRYDVMVSVAAIPGGDYVLFSDHEAALKEAVKKEREACAMVCNQNNGDMAWQLEAKIRARSDK
jgi:hypothetical protein